MTIKQKRRMDAIIKDRNERIGRLKARIRRMVERVTKMEARNIARSRSMRKATKGTK